MPNLLSQNKHHILIAVSFCLLSVCDCVAWAQRGEGHWEEVLATGEVDKTQRAYVHFENKDKEFWSSPWKIEGSIRHFAEGYSYDPRTKTETFIAFESPDNHRPSGSSGGRITKRELTSFQGELLIEDNVTDDVWVMQLWHAALIKYRNDQGTGTLTYHSANDATGEARVGIKELAENIRGKKVLINVIHSGAPSFDLSLTVSVEGQPLNGGKPFTFKTFDATGTFYIKYGAYCGPGKQQNLEVDRYSGLEEATDHGKRIRWSIVPQLSSVRTYVAANSVTSESSLRCRITARNFCSLNGLRM